MTQVKYTPSDFKIPVSGKITYSDLFEEAKWERCAEYIMLHCIHAGYWKPVKVLPDEHNPESMIQAGYLENTREGFVLTEKALEKILESFPVEF